MGKSNSYRLLQAILRKIPDKALLVFKPLLRNKIYGLCNGYWMEFDLGEQIQRQVYCGRYETVQSGWAKEVLNVGGTFLDVGANVGYYTTLAASLVGKQGKVLAFEPSPFAYRKLASIIKGNGISQIEAFQCAAGDKEEMLDLYLSNQTQIHSPSLVPSDAAFTPVKVQVCRLDAHSSLRSMRSIDLMKLDVEGFEPNVIRGMSDHLGKGYVKYLLCEFNSGWLEPNKSSCSQLLQLIQDLGFVVYKETPNATPVGANGAFYQHRDILFKHITCR
ncbi:MAG: FkbM family methyltransferase [Candidatus Omnitrophota bacterium]|jgi:FkbM family methyltransferase